MLPPRPCTHADSLRSSITRLGGIEETDTRDTFAFFIVVVLQYIRSMSFR